MKKWLLCLVIFFHTFICFAETPHAVTYDFSGGRFGDNLLSFLHAKWISYRYQIPLVYRPFNYSSYLNLDEIEKQSLPHPLSQEVILWEIEALNLQLHNPTLFIARYFPEAKSELADGKDAWGSSWSYFAVDWKDPEFRKVAWESIKPKQYLYTIIPPQDKVSIAVHVREGGGFDDCHYSKMPLKRPPLSFYSKGILKMMELFKGKSLYFYIFTDAQDPAGIVKKIKSKIAKSALGKNVTIDYRTFGNHHDANVLEDFFSLFNFDALIFPISNFSIVPSLLKDYAVLYSPQSTRKGKKTIVVDQVDVVINNEIYKKLLNEK